MASIIPRQQLSTTLARTCRFLIRNDAELPPGDLLRRTSTGRQIDVDDATSPPHEEETEASLKDPLSEVLGEAKT